MKEKLEFDVQALEGHQSRWAYLKGAEIGPHSKRRRLSVT